MSWSDSARETIQKIHATLPADATFEQRVKALRDGYPFGERRMHPYKMWCQEQRRYLAQFQPQKDTKRFPLSPMERMMARSKA